MDVVVSQLICLFAALVEVFSAVPPDVCFHQFKWEDCGMPPKAVIYYYKSGSRCEVGFWRGCQPNPNMFADEYDCVQTCIFSLRAKPHDFHQFQDNVIESEDDAAATFGITDAGNTGTTSNGTDATGTNTGDGGGNNTDNGSSGDGSGGDDGSGGGVTDGGVTDGGVTDGGVTDGGVTDAATTIAPDPES